jgi:hypothetical protein
MIKIAVLTFIIPLSVMSVIAQSDNPLKGTWNCNTGYESVTLAFINSNTLTYNGEQYTYQLSQSNLVINDEGISVYYPYAFYQGSLYITFPEGYTLQFQQISKNLSQDIKTPPAKSGQSSGMYLCGKLCEYGASSSYSAYSSYSHMNMLYFDGNGNFQFGSEFAYSGEAGYAYNDRTQNLERGTYQISDNQVHCRFNSGETYSLSIHMVQNDGQITELMYGEKLYAAGLCE